MNVLAYGSACCCAAANGGWVGEWVGGWRAVRDAAAVVLLLYMVDADGGVGGRCRVVGHGRTLYCGTFSFVPEYRSR